MLLYSRILPRPSSLLPAKSLGEEEKENGKLQEDPPLRTVSEEVKEHNKVQELDLPPEQPAESLKGKEETEDVKLQEDPSSEQSVECFSTVEWIDRPVDSEQSSSSNSSQLEVINNGKLSSPIDSNDATISSAIDFTRDAPKISNGKNPRVQLKPLFAPGFLGKQSSNKGINQEDKVQTNEVAISNSFCRNGGDEERQTIVHEIGDCGDQIESGKESRTNILDDTLQVWI